MTHRINSLVAALLAILLLFGSVAFAEEPEKELVYLRAVELISQNQSDAALAVLALIPGYKDVDILFEEIKTAKLEAYYKAAMEKIGQGQFDAAIAIFGLIPGYKDSDIQAVLAADGKKQGRYEAAIALKGARAYDDALKIFRELGPYADSAAQIALIYQQQAAEAFDVARALEKEGKYSEAIAAYQALTSTPEIAERILACKNELAKAAFLAELNALKPGNDALAYYRELLAMEAQNTTTIAQFDGSPFDALIYEQGAAILNQMDSAEEAAILLARFDTSKKQSLLQAVEDPLWRLSILRKLPTGDEAVTTLLADTLLTASEVKAGNDPKAAFALIAEASANGGKELALAEAYDNAAMKQIAQTFGADVKTLLYDAQTDGVPEYVISGGGRFTLGSRTAEGLTFNDAPQSLAYESLKLEKTPDGQQYIIGKAGHMTHFIQAREGGLVILLQAEDLQSHEWTATGVVLRFLLGGVDYRKAQTEYIIMDNQAVALPETRVLDMTKYPERRSALALVNMYGEAKAFSIPEEMALLIMEGADLTKLDVFLDSHKQVDSADIYLWDSDAKLYHCVVEAGGERIALLMDLGRDGQYMLVGAP